MSSHFDLMPDFSDEPTRFHHMAITAIGDMRSIEVADCKEDVIRFNRQHSERYILDYPIPSEFDGMYIPSRTIIYTDLPPHKLDLSIDRVRMHTARLLIEFVLSGGDVYETTDELIDGFPELK